MGSLVDPEGMSTGFHKTYDQDCLWDFSGFLKVSTVARGIGCCRIRSSGTGTRTASPTMSVTLTANYKEVLNTETVEKIEELLEDCHELSCMLEFIDEHNEEDFVNYYEEYVRCGEAIGYEAVDALIDEMGDVSYIEDCDERYQGCYDDEADFAEDFINEMGYDIPSIIVVDWEATWESSLRYDYTACNDGSTYRPCHIFRDH